MQTNPQILLDHIEQVHTTPMGADRIKRNLSLEKRNQSAMDEAAVVAWCKEQICSHADAITRCGKNWYVDIGVGTLTVNASAYTIITAH